MEQERVAQAELDAIDKDVLAQVDDAVAFAEESPCPPPESLYEDVYVRSPYIHMKAAEKDPAWRAARDASDRAARRSFPALDPGGRRPAKVEG